MRNNKLKNKKNVKKSGQVTIFVIIAIVIVAVIIVFFLFRDNIFGNGVPRELEPVYSYYLTCIQDETSNGAKILGEKGGRIEEIDFSPGTSYMPFSSHLGFLGQGIPYWYYISGNGLPHEQLPTKDKMQSDLDNFVKSGLMDCDFSQFEARGFQVNISSGEVKTEIKDSNINIKVNQEISIAFGDKTWNGKSHSVSVNSNLGKFYDMAVRVYKNEKDSMFLENYGIDILRLYAPVDGSDISCSSKIWDVNAVRNNLTRAIEENTAAIKIKGNYYKLNNPDNKYFVRDLGVKNDFNVNFMYSGYWPTKIEVWPSEDDILRADPVGLDQGMGVIGFCYVPYHFVYDMGYPVLIQIYSGDEMFQFPVVVYIDKNQPRKALNATGLSNVVPELCQHKSTRLNVHTYNVNLEPVPSQIKFKCFDTSCDIGQTKIENGDAILNGDFPQCVNGFVIASADGYETKRELVSTLTGGDVNIVLAKKYKLNLAIHETGSEIDGYAVVTFTKDNKTSTISYPDTKEIELTEGPYVVKVYAYSNASIHLQGSSTPKCVDVPVSGLSGYFGATDQKCFNLDIPSQDVSSAISGGGVQKTYFPESQLAESKNMTINIDDFGVPKSVEELQNNYNKVDVSSIDISFQS